MGIWSFLAGRPRPRFLRRGTAAGRRPAAGARRPLRLETLEDRCLLSADVWTQRGGDAGHTSYVETSFDPANLEEAWSQSLGYTQSGTGSWQERGVAIDENHVYRVALEGYAPSGTYHVIAYDLQTGAEVWHQTLVGGAFEGVGEPSVANGIVYVNRAGHSGISGGTSSDLPRLYGFDAQTGAVVLQQTYAAQWGSNERPVIADNQLVVENGYYGGISAYTASTLTRQWFVGRSAAYDPPFAALDDEYVYAFGDEVYRRSDGTRLADITHPGGLSTVADPMVSGSGQVYFEVSGYVSGSTKYGLSAFDGDTHEHLWTTYTPTYTGAKAAGNGVVVVTAGQQLLVLDEDDGSQLLSWQAPLPLTQEIVLTQTHVFVQSATSGLARVHAIDLATGQEVWTYDNRISTEPAIMEMALGGDHLLLSHHQFVRAFEVGAANQAPDAVDDGATTNEDTAVTIDVLANDSDGDGDPLTVTAVGEAAHGSVTLNPDGTISYSPDANYHGTDSFTYTIGDGQGGSDTATVSLAIAAVNDAPEVSDAAFTLAENTGAGTQVGTVQAGDVDGDTLTYRLSGAGASAFTISATGAISVADPALLDYETTRYFDLVVEVDDGAGGVATANVRIDLTDVLEVAIDIAPDDAANTIRLDSKEVQVAILGSSTFDPATQVDLQTLRLQLPGSSTGAGVVDHQKHGYKYEVSDVNGDGFLDLVVSFKTSEIGLHVGDTQLQLSGSLLPNAPGHGGELFTVEQTITVVEGRTKGGKTARGNKG